MRSSHSVGLAIRWNSCVLCKFWEVIMRMSGNRPEIFWNYSIQIVWSVTGRNDFFITETNVSISYILWHCLIFLWTLWITERSWHPYFWRWARSVKIMCNMFISTVTFRGVTSYHMVLPNPRSRNSFAKYKSLKDLGDGWIRWFR